jgi:hypothetical protein
MTINRLFSIANSWVGTPFKQGMGVKGKGTDCYHLMSNIIQEYRLLPYKDDLPTILHGQQHKAEDILTNIRKHYSITQVDTYYPGSFVLYTTGTIYLLCLYFNEYQILTVNRQVTYFPLLRFKNYQPLIFKVNELCIP